VAYTGEELTPHPVLRRNIFSAFSLESNALKGPLWLAGWLAGPLAGLLP